ncbi:MAG TPA: hypothetical protein VF918_23655 [Anaerolineales bacterium]
MTREACEEFMFGEGGVVQRIAEEQYGSALEAITSQAHLYPEISKVLSALHISLAAHLGDTPQALHVMEKALAAGIYLPAAVFSEEADPPGYATLFGNPSFEHLKKLHQEAYRGAIDKAAPVLNRIHPITRDNTPPLLIAFHRGLDGLFSVFSQKNPCVAVAPWRHCPWAPCTKKDFVKRP